MLTLPELRRRLKALLAEDVEGVDAEQKLVKAEAYVRELRTRANPFAATADANPELSVVPFEPGRRPLDDARTQGAGVSEASGYLDSSAAADGAARPSAAGASFLPVRPDEAWLLYRMRHLEQMVLIHDEPVSVRMSATFLPRAADEAPSDVPSIRDRDVPLRVVSPSAYPSPALEDASPRDFSKATYVAALPTARLLPGEAYRWEDVDQGLRARTPDGRDPFTFAHQFHQRVRVDLSLRSATRELSSSRAEIEIFDVGRMGSLYARVLDTLVTRDIEAQAARLGAQGLDVQHHPWFPVLAIGMDKASLYLRGIKQDMDWQLNNLPDPAWLMKVGLYLELLTCLGIFEAVRAEHPNLLSTAERHAFETSGLYAAVRARVDARAWSEVWALREVDARGANVLAAGPVSVLNLRRKQRATLAFLHAHHEDLKAAIELAGPNPGSGQETWHRVFRDAERAVFRNAMVAFPELAFLEGAQREFALWHQRGKLLGRVALPASFTGLFGDQDALYPSACRQYRQSMNDVAAWAKQKKLMDFTGAECVPKSASLLEATMEGNGARVASLQRHDGYGPSLESEEAHVAAAPETFEEVLQFLEAVPLFKPLMDRERQRLARAARRVSKGPHDRVVIEGQVGASLFLVVSGFVEVLVRGEGGEDVPVATLERGAVFGEMALLTGAPRAATVRVVSDAVLYEIAKDAIAPVIASRPALVVELAMLMARRRQADDGRTPPRGADGGLASKISRFFFG